MKRGRVCTHCLSIEANPICPFCLFKETAQWIDEQRILSRTEKICLARILRSNLASSEKNNLLQNCIICHRLHGEVCLSCFVNKSIKTLKKMRFSITKINNFILAFQKMPYMVWSIV